MSGLIEAEEKYISNGIALKKRSSRGYRGIYPPVGGKLLIR
jgi:hypothetical protein